MSQSALHKNENSHIKSMKLLHKLRWVWQIINRMKNYNKVFCIHNDIKQISLRYLIYDRKPSIEIIPADLFLSIIL